MTRTRAARWMQGIALAISCIVATSLFGCGGPDSVDVAPVSPDASTFATSTQFGAGGGVSDSERAICDGSAGLRFAAAVPWNGPVERGTGLFYELGVEYVFVTGRCEFFVWNKDPAVTSNGVWSAVRHGILSVDEARELANDFGYASWPERDGATFGPDEALFDGPALVLFDGEHRTVCHKPCASSAPELASGLEGLSGWTRRLYALGADLEDKLRLRVFEMPTYPGQTLVAWPLTAAPSDFLSSDDENDDAQGESAYVIAHAEGGAGLRALRAQLKQRPPPQDHTAAATAHPSAEMAYVFAFRDVLPFENEQGGVTGMFSLP